MTGARFVRFQRSALPAVAVGRVPSLRRWLAPTYLTRCTTHRNISHVHLHYKHLYTNYKHTSCTRWFSTVSNASEPAPIPSPPAPFNTAQQDADKRAQNSTHKQPVSWIDRAPPAMQPYLHLSRLDKPIGTYLLFLPCTWGIALGTGAHNIHTAAQLATYMFIGAVAMRGAGCTINDMWDRQYDRNVSRTRTRPLASGQLSMTQATAYMIAQVLVGCAVVIQLDNNTILLACASLPIVAVYPAMKRLTHWPQFVLGLAFNWGVLVGYSAVYAASVEHIPSLQSLLLHSQYTYTELAVQIYNALPHITQYINNTAVISLYVAGICWTIMYDTIYAFQDVLEDKSLGLKSTAILFYNYHTAWLSAFAAGMIGCLVAAGVAMQASVIYYTLSVAGAALHCIWQIATLNKHSRSSCSQRFVSNKWLGALVGTGILLDRLAASQDKRANIHPLPHGKQV